MVSTLSGKYKKNKEGGGGAFTRPCSPVVKNQSHLALEKGPAFDDGSAWLPVPAGATELLHAVA